MSGKRTVTAPSMTPPKINRLHLTRSAKDHPPITRETLRADIDAWCSAGGEIELLGVTRSLKHIGADAEPASTPPPAEPTACHR